LICILNITINRKSTLYEQTADFAVLKKVVKTVTIALNPVRKLLLTNGLNTAGLQKPKYSENATIANAT
jgi:hypothetical protein